MCAAISAADARLLPSSDDAFRTKTFWESFFAARAGSAFEWYGDWKTLRPLMDEVVPASPSASATTSASEDRILVPGCGNSALSSELYDAGRLAITNVDFSPTAIREMMAQNLRARPRMRWQVMDVTQMRFEDASFDVILDKGMLDALMGEPGDVGGAEAGRAFLDECRRVLDGAAANGRGPRFLAITMAQSHVVRALLDAFADPAPSGGTRSLTWRLAFRAIPPTDDMKDSPWQPLAVVATAAPSGAPDPGASLDVSFDAAPQSTSMQATRAEVAAWQREARVHRDAREAARKADVSERLRDPIPAGKGRVLVALPRDVDPAQPEVRFNAAVLDLEERGEGSGAGGSAGGLLPCAAFLVPQGREHEWLFRDEAGQQELLAGCQTRRLVVVSLVRGQSYGSMQAIQKELSPLVLRLVPAALRDASGGAPAIPIMSMGAEGVGHRQEVHRGQSEMNGPIVVEDVRLAAEEGEGAPRVVRRMVFLDSSNLIQSEAMLLPAHPKSKERSKKGKHRKKDAKKGAKGGGTSAAPAVDVGHLCSDYHVAIAAGVPLAAAAGAAGDPRVLLVGLGGGGLAMFLHGQFKGADVTTVELDPAVASLAAQFFGFTEGPRVRCVVGDGLDFIQGKAQRDGEGKGEDKEAYSLAIIDASGSAAEAVSCPPASFLAPGVLSNLKGLLREGGVLATNVVCRTEAAFAPVAAAFVGAFGAGNVLCARGDDDVNRVVLAVRQEGGSGDAKALKAGAMAALAPMMTPEAQGGMRHRDDIQKSIHALEAIA